MTFMALSKAEGSAGGGWGATADLRCLSSEKTLFF